MTFFTAFGVANSAPSYAETVSNPVSIISNEQHVVLVPALIVEPIASAVEVTPEGVPAPAPKATSLAQLVSRQTMPATLDREAECLAASVYFESKSEPLEGQLAVAEVVINRAESGRFASSICKVVFQRGQFSFVRAGGFPPIVKTGRHWREAVAIAQIAMNDGWDSRAPKALFFHATRVSPRWNKVRVATLGNHVFYR